MRAATLADLDACARICFEGFKLVKVPLAVLSGTYAGGRDPVSEVRALRDTHFEECASLYEHVHGISPANEIRDAVSAGTAWGATRSGRVVAYASAPSRWPINHGVTVLPWCPYARSWLEKHPDEAARITIDWSDPPE